MRRTILVVSLLTSCLFGFLYLKKKKKQDKGGPILNETQPVLIWRLPKHVDSLFDMRGLSKSLGIETLQHVEKEIQTNLTTHLLPELSNLVFSYVITPCPGFRPIRRRATPLYHICEGKDCTTQFLVLADIDLENFITQYGCDIFLVDGGTKLAEKTRLFGRLQVHKNKTPKLTSINPPFVEATPSSFLN